MGLIDTDREKCDYCGKLAPYNCTICAKDLCGFHRTHHNHTPIDSPL